VPLELLVGCAALAIEGYTALLKTGGSINDVLPAYLAVGLLAGLALGSRDRLATLLSGMLVLAQTFFLVVGIHPAAVLPTSADSAAGARLASGMRALGGDAVAPNEPELSLQAGTALTAHPQAALDVVNANDPNGQASFNSSVAQAVADHQYSAIIGGGGGVPLFDTQITKDYQECKQPGPVGPNTVLYPQPGGKVTVPAFVWIPKGGRTCQYVFSILNGGKETDS
jgi:hypothetical protein